MAGCKFERIAIIEANNRAEANEQMTQGIVKFYYTKVDGTTREAYGTLNPSIMPETKGTERKHNPTIQTYYDTEKCEYRCFKVANLVKIV